MENQGYRLELHFLFLTTTEHLLPQAWPLFDRVGQTEPIEYHKPKGTEYYSLLQFSLLCLRGHLSFQEQNASVTYKQSSMI